MRIRTAHGTYRAEDLIESIVDQATDLDDFKEKLRLGFPGWDERWYREREEEYELGRDEGE